jgi:hypothetical protein
MKVSARKQKETKVMKLKHGLCTAALAIPLLVLGTGSSVAHDDDVGLSFGFGSPYYLYDDYPYSYGFRDPFYDPYYDDVYFRGGVFLGADVDMDDEVEVIEPAAAPAEPQGCVKTNVKNLKNACPN